MGDEQLAGVQHWHSAVVLRYYNVSVPFGIYVLCGCCGYILGNFGPGGGPSVNAGPTAWIGLVSRRAVHDPLR